MCNVNQDISGGGGPTYHRRLTTTTSNNQEILNANFHPKVIQIIYWYIAGIRGPCPRFEVEHMSNN